MQNDKLVLSIILNIFKTSTATDRILDSGAFDNLSKSGDVCVQMPLRESVSVYD